MDTLYVVLKNFYATYSDLIIISFLHFLTWSYCLKIKGWVSDDIEGLAKFSDRFIQEKDQQGNITKEYKIDSYDTDRKDKDGKLIQIKNTAWPDYLGWPACFMRWFRLQIGKTFREIAKNSKGHSIYGYVQDARKHHAFNILVQWFNLLLGYNFLTHLFGHNLALVATLLFALHPCNVQTVGWISGVNYLLSIFFALLTFNSVLYINNLYITLPLTAFLSYASCTTLLPGCFNFVILLMMGRINESIIAGIIGIYSLLTMGKGIVDYRVNAFKEQQMGKSTYIYWRKIIIMVKTFWYYTRLIIFPKRLGLFHTWGYHFEEPIEHLDKDFWLGILALITYGLIINFSPFPIRFGLVWALSYILIFSNLITAQQFVSERYAFYSLFGVALAGSFFFQGHPVILAFILGIYIMRIWVHLPTFLNEVRFYESNCFNFPTSEVAMGNLGVSYLNHGMHHKAYDTWLQASQQNPLYDVPWYNLYSLSKQNGDIIGARNFLQKCLNAKTIHFPGQWQKEMEDLDKLIATAISDGRLKIVSSPIIQKPT